MDPKDPYHEVTPDFLQTPPPPTGMSETRRRNLARKRAKKWRRACHYGCGRPGWTEDHVIPVSRIKGRNTRFTVPCCNLCNNQRGDRPYPSFALSRGVDEAVVYEVMRKAVVRWTRIFPEVPVPLVDLMDWGFDMREQWKGEDAG
jgi:hypothetical protein